MQKDNLMPLKATRIELHEIEIQPELVYFTGNAIALWNERTRGTIVDLDDWSWHKDTRSEGTHYIVTDIKAA